MPVKTEHVLLGVAGGGLLLIGGYFWYSEYEKNKHIDEYLDKVQRAEIAYQNAIDAENYEKAQQVLDFYQGIMDSEEKIINAEGGHTKLVKALTRLIGVAFAGALTYKIIDWLLKKHPPPNIKCPYDGSTFPTSKALEDHLVQVHGQELVPAQVPAAEGAYERLKDWIKNLLSATSGVARSALDRDWGNLTTVEIVAIALAAALIIAFIVLDPFGWFAGLWVMARMVATVVV